MLNSPDKKPNVDHLVDLLRAACEDTGMNDMLERLLSQPEERRELLLRELLYLATTEALPFDERRQDMIAVMALAGF